MPDSERAHIWPYIRSQTWPTLRETLAGYFFTRAFWSMTFCQTVLLCLMAASTSLRMQIFISAAAARLETPKPGLKYKFMNINSAIWIPSFAYRFGRERVERAAFWQLGFTFHSFPPPLSRHINHFHGPLFITGAFIWYKISRCHMTWHVRPGRADIEATQKVYFAKIILCVLVGKMFSCQCDNMSVNIF